MKTNKPHRYWVLSGLLLTLAATEATACIWVSGTTIDGGRERVGGLNPLRRVIRAMEESPASRLNELRERSDARAADSAEALEFAGVELLLEGRAEAAVLQLVQLEEKFPGRYATAANLGTAYELAGDIRQALKWIGEGINRNEDSHFGSEWVHVAILEAKSELEKNPDWLLQRRVIPLPGRFDADDEITIGGRARTVRDISAAVLYQLEERVVFVKPKDPVVADLLFSFARIQAQTGVVENGLKALKLSREYGFADDVLLAATIARYERIITWGKIRWYSTVTVVSIGAVWLLWFAYRRKWFFLSTKDLNAYKASLMERKPEAEGPVTVSDSRNS